MSCTAARKTARSVGVGGTEPARLPSAAPGCREDAGCWAMMHSKSNERKDNRFLRKNWLWYIDARSEASDALTL